MQPVARAGLASRAAIYLVLSVLAFLIVARGHSPSQASGSGALAEIAKQPAGPFLLGVLSAGLLCYAVWRLLQAVFGVEPAASDRPSYWRRFGWLLIAGLYVALFAEALSILFGSGGSGGPSNHPQGDAARLLSLPGGPGWLGLVGAALAIGGVSLGLWGCLHDYGEVLEKDRMNRPGQLAARLTGATGNLTRGALLVLVAVYFLMAAVENTPSKVKSLDQALESVVHQPTGPVWIGLAAFGLLAYASHSVLETIYRRI